MVGIPGLYLHLLLLGVHYCMKVPALSWWSGLHCCVPRWVSILGGMDGQSPKGCCWIFPSSVLRGTTSHGLSTMMVSREVNIPHPAVDLHMHAWATNTGGNMQEHYQFSPPNAVACLTAWLLICHWILQILRSLQEELKNVSRLTVFEIDSRVVIEPIRLFDCHIHCDALVRRMHLPAWDDVMEYQRMAYDSTVDTFIFSCNFPTQWDVSEEILKHRSVFLSVGLHPHVISGGIRSKDYRWQDVLLQHHKCVAAGEGRQDVLLQHHKCVAAGEGRQDVLLQHHKCVAAGEGRQDVLLQHHKCVAVGEGRQDVLLQHHKCVAAGEVGRDSYHKLNKIITHIRHARISWS